jgi:sulfur-carrier protein
MENQETTKVRVCLPFHLRNLAQVGLEVTVDAARPVTVKSVLDAIEAQYPMLRGTIRDYDTGKRRAFLRFFACEEDYSLEPMETELPQAVAEGREPLLVVGAIAGGAN